MLNFKIIPQVLITRIDTPIYYQLAPENTPLPYVIYDIITDLPFSDFCQTYNSPILQVGIYIDAQQQDIFDAEYTIRDLLANYSLSGIRFDYLSTTTMPTQSELPNNRSFIHQYRIWEEE